MAKKKTVGHPKTFESGDEVLNLFTEFCEELYCNDQSIYVPTKTDFCLWLKNEKGFSCDRRTLYNTLNLYFPDIKKEFDEIRGDTLVNGAMRGKYQPTMTIFALKNWCAWTDKTEATVDSKVQVEMSGELEEWSE